MTIDNHLTIVAFCGPSGSGKSVLVDNLRSTYPDNILKWTQVTTRPRRSSNDDYMFITKNKYDIMRDMLTCRTQFNGNYYGTMPESVLTGDTAVVTIADAVGLKDLAECITLHNELVQVGGVGQFGDQLVRLVTIMVTYTVDKAAVIERGRTSRGVEYITNEIDALLACGVNIDTVIDTSAGWPTAVDIFDKYIWDAISTPFNGDNTAKIIQDIEAAMNTVKGKLHGLDATSLTNINTTLNQLNDQLKSVKTIMSEEQLPFVDDVNVVIDDIDALLDGDAPQSLHNETDPIHGVASEDDGSELTMPTDAINDRPYKVDELIETVDVIEPEASVAQDTPVDAVAADTPDETPAEPIKATVEETDSTPLKVYADPISVLESVDFIEWLAENNIGVEVFSNELQFKISMQHFLANNGVDPAITITVTTQSTKDSRGGAVSEFAAVIGNTQRVYRLEYNSRLKRPVNFDLSA